VIIFELQKGTLFMKVLIVGLGKMGERYQTVLQKLFSEDFELTVVDPKKPIICKADVYENIHHVPKEKKFDLAIDSRPNYERLDTLKRLVERKVPKVIVEKPHATSLLESKQMIQLIKSQDTTQVMIPFYRRFSPFFDINFLNRIDAGELKCITITSGAIGIGCNGVHLLDSANNMMCENPISVYADMEMDSIFSPRGPEYSDHSGVLIVEYPNKRRLTLNVIANSSAGISTGYFFEHGKILINEQQQPFWKWYRRSEEHISLPIHRTHLEKEITTPEDYSLDLFDLIKAGINTFIKTPDKVPNLESAHRVLETIALGIESSFLCRKVNWHEKLVFKSLESKPFSFT
jgi:predicted dehydrogenase